MIENERPIPPQDLDESRLERTRAQREAEGETSLGDEAVAHERSLPRQRKPGADAPAPDASEIAHEGADAAGSAAQTGKPGPTGRSR